MSIPFQTKLPLIIAIAAAPTAVPPPAATVEYLANEGVLISAGERVVLIDGLFGDGLPDYPSVEPATRDSLERGLGRFGGIDAILVTHVHKDHFDAAAVARHLAANPGARLIAPSQAADTLRAELGELDDLAERIHTVTPQRGVTKRFEVQGVEILAVGLVHPPSRNEPVELVGYRVDMGGGMRVAHLGDASPSPAELTPFRDVALLLAPWWILAGSEGERRLEAIRARRTAAFHLARQTAATDVREGITAAAAVEVLRRAGTVLRIDP